MKISLDNTTVFAVSQAINLIQKIVVNKLISYFLGVNAFGFIAYVSSVIDFSRSLCVMGVNQSVIKELAKNHADPIKQRNLIQVASRYFTASSILGACLATIYLFVVDANMWKGMSLGILEFLFLTAFASFFNILSIGYLGIIKGLYNTFWIAFTISMSALVSIGVAPFLINHFGLKGGLISYSVPAFITVLIAIIYFSKIKKQTRYKGSEFEWLQSMKGLLRQGSVITLTGLMSTAVHMITIKNMLSGSNLMNVGLYNAGYMLIVGYFSIISNALLTDFFPRISKNAFSKEYLRENINSQSMLTLNLVIPIVIIFLGTIEPGIKLMFSTEFLDIKSYTKIAIIGSVILLFSNLMDLTLLARNMNKSFIIIASSCKITELVFNIFLYNFYGLEGLACSFVGMSILHFVLTYRALKKDCSFKFSNNFIRRVLWAIPILVMFEIALRAVSEINEYLTGAFCILSGIMYFVYYKRSDGKHNE